MFGQRSARTRKRLEEHGTVASATVLEISDRGTAVTHGRDSMVTDTEVALKTRLRIEPEGEPAFEVEQRFRYPQLSVPSAGDRLTVRFDPDDHDDVMIDRDALPLLSSSTLDRFSTKNAGTIGDILAAAQGARQAHPGDSDAMADAVRATLGVPNGPTAFAFPDMSAFAMPTSSSEEQRIAGLERLAALRDKGVLTPEEFAAEKAKLLGNG